MRYFGQNEAIFYLLTGMLGSSGSTSAQSTQTPQQSLDAYHASLGSLRREWPDAPLFPETTVFFLGMGDRRKMVYQRGELRDARSGEVLRKWEVTQEYILPSDYTVLLQDERGRWITLRETGTGVLIDDGRGQAFLTRSPLHLPTFRGKKYASVLRVLHHEILMHTGDHEPLPGQFSALGVPLGPIDAQVRILRLTNNARLLPPASEAPVASTPPSTKSAAELFLLLLER